MINFARFRNTNSNFHNLCGQRGIWYVVSNYYHCKITKPQPVLRNLQGSSWYRWWVLYTRLLNSNVP